jgi:ATP-binding cassette subfamily F protein uup
VESHRRFCGSLLFPPGPASCAGRRKPPPLQSAVRGWRAWRKSLLLTCRSLSKSFGARPLFRDISVSFDDAERTGLIGPNGSGKSTLLRILAGIEPPDSGEIVTRRGLKLAYLPQEDVFPQGLMARDVVAAAVPHGQAEEHELLTRADILLGKAGFERTDVHADTLSGGWRKRLAVCRELMKEPDLLLLDEPTNHLDLEGVLWLENLLRGAPFSFLLVSHDRYFLENATNRVVELSRAYADGYLSCNGSYSDFLVRREEYLAAQARNEQALAGKVRREVEWLRRGAKARTTKAKGRINEAGRMMDELAELKTRSTQGGAVRIDFTATQRQTRKLLAAKGVSKRLGDRRLFEGLDLVLSPGTRLGLIGPNGSGKTTLIRLLAGELDPDAGEVFRAEGLRTVVFDQGRRRLDKSETLRRALSLNGSDTVVYRDSPMHVVSWAKRFLFHSEQLDMPVADLSGGEQARVMVARLMLQPANLLILDEPTNDLDIASLEVLEESLLDFPGALVLVTHDRFMLDRVSTQVLALDGNGGAAHYADYGQWERSREEAQRDAAAAARATAKPAPKAGAAPAKKRLTYMELRELEGMEAAILAAEEALQSLQAEMDDPATMADRHRFAEVCTNVDAAQQRVHALYERWQELEARRER